MPVAGRTVKRCERGAAMDSRGGSNGFFEDGFPTRLGTGTLKRHECRVPTRDNFLDMGR